MHNLLGIRMKRELLQSLIYGKVQKKEENKVKNEFYKKKDEKENTLTH